MTKKSTMTDAQRQLRNEVNQSLERAFETSLKKRGVYAWRTQYSIAEDVGYVYDFAWPAARLVVEINGGLRAADGKSGHKSYTGITRDYKKLNAATSRGWSEFIFHDEAVLDDSAALVVKQFLKAKGYPYEQ